MLAVISNRDLPRVNQLVLAWTGGVHHRQPDKRGAGQGFTLNKVYRGEVEEARQQR